jgi:hypothetical protein
VSVIACGPRVLLLVFLATACTAKLWDGYQQHYAISRSLFVTATSLEVAFVLGLLVPRFRAATSAGVGVMAAIGIGVAFWSQGKSCGCLGSMIRLTSAQQILLNATVGALSVVAWHCEVMARQAPVSASMPSGADR